MFAIVQNKEIVQLVPEGTPFTFNQIQYPADWCNLSTPEEKAAIGMVDVIYGQPKSDQYYWVSQDAPVYDANQNVVVIGYTNTPKDLTSVKTNAINQIDSTAYSLLFPTDWMVVKAMETSTKVPADWNVWRESIRVTAAQAKKQVEAAPDVDVVANLTIDWPKSPEI